jgi:tRNA A-37 threonylcarbamoyl transferase component Bud32/membrane-associated phospholipid phosphatase
LARAIARGGTIGNEALQPAKELYAAQERIPLRSKRRRRPSGRPPPLPRELGASGRFWIGALIALLAFIVSLILVSQAGNSFERQENTFLRWFAVRRTGWLDDTMLALNGLGSTFFTRTIRLGTILALIGVRRWRHLFVLIGSILLVAWITNNFALVVPRPRPFGLRIIGGWEGSPFPSRPVAELSVALVGVLYTLLPHGRWRDVGKFVAGTLLGALAAAQIYLGLNHPTDIVFALILGIGIPLIAFRWLTPNSVFPIRYGRGKAAHLDVGGPRGTAIREAVRDQLGMTVLDIKPVGLAGSGGSTPLRITVAGDPDDHLFAKLYAQTHLRADRSYKIGRTILYGTLEDEKSYNSVRRLVQYEDYILRVMYESGIACAKSYGFVEITPEREYLLVTDFLEGGTEITEAEVDDDVIDDALSTIRRMWEVGVAHRDVKPANIMVRDGKIVLIDLAFGEIRPSPWRQAVDLANMMLVLALQTDPDRVYQRALRFFSADEIAEAFAATRGLTMPSQSRALLKARQKEGRDLLARFRELAPKRRPISIQRWSVRRIGLTLLVAAGFLLALLLTLDNIQTGAL